MPKLYHHEGNWQLPGQQDRKAARVDIPNAPADLAAWLQERHVARDPWSVAGVTITSAIVGQEEGPGPELSGRPSGPRVPGFCDSCGRSAAGSLKLASGNDLDAIGQWMETAELWAIKQLVERARDVVRARGEALDGKGVQ